MTGQPSSKPIGEGTQQPQPPADLPRAAKLFWSTHPDFDRIEAYHVAATSKVLDVLGPPPFPKAGFPFMGFLATVYEHVATHVGTGVGPASGGPGQPA